MSPTVKIDMRAFNDSIARLKSVNKRETTDFMRRLGKELLKYLVRLTPPFGTNPFTETFGMQLKAGREAIKNDLESGFLPIRTFEIANDPDSKLGNSFKRLVRQGRLAEASDLARKANFRIAGFIEQLDAEAHKRLRTARGRVIRRMPFIVTKSASVGQRIRKVQQRVGFAKAGWMAAVNKLKLAGIPQWIKRHTTPGSCTETGVGTPRYTITMHNRVKYGLRFETSIVPAALRKLQGSINAQYTRLLNLRHARRRG